MANIAIRLGDAREFYTRLGYKQVARVNDYPVGHSDVFYAKCLDRRIAHGDRLD